VADQRASAVWAVRKMAELRSIEFLTCGRISTRHAYLFIKSVGGGRTQGRCLGCPRHRTSGLDSRDMSLRLRNDFQVLFIIFIAYSHFPQSHNSLLSINTRIFLSRIFHGCRTYSAYSVLVSSSCIFRARIFTQTILRGARSAPLAAVGCVMVGAG
jgi:hypothetical protein